MISIFSSNFKNFASLHSYSILSYCDERKTKYSESKLNRNVTKHFGAFVSDFRNFISATPEKLFEMKKHFDSLTSIEQAAIRDEFKVTALYTKFLSKDLNYIDSDGNQYNSKVLISKLDICTCPYCNENYTYAFLYGKNMKTIKRTFDWDHLYPVKYYPFFAICYFNLVPSCKVCNFIKLDQNYNYFNPHLAVNVDDIYHFDVTPMAPGFISNTNAISLNIRVRQKKYGQEIKDTIFVNGLLGRFRWHKELIKDILNKKRIYNDTYISTLKNQIHSLTSIPDIEIKKTIFGIFFSHEDYYKRPFSKLTNDILRN